MWATGKQTAAVGLFCDESACCSTWLYLRYPSLTPSSFGDPIYFESHFRLCRLLSKFIWSAYFRSMAQTTLSLGMGWTVFPSTSRNPQSFHLLTSNVDPHQVASPLPHLPLRKATIQPPEPLYPWIRQPHQKPMQ